MERKNSQQSQHGKQESSMASGSGAGGGGSCAAAAGGGESIKWECDPSVQELIGDTEIRVKIAGMTLRSFSAYLFINHQ